MSNCYIRGQMTTRVAGVRIPLMIIMTMLYLVGWRNICLINPSSDLYSCTATFSYSCLHTQQPSLAQLQLQPFHANTNNA